MEESGAVLVLMVFVDLKPVTEESVWFCSSQYCLSWKNGEVYLRY